MEFCQDKIISTIGEGGMVTTNDKNIWQYIWSYKDHGKIIIQSSMKIILRGFDGSIII